MSHVDILAEDVLSYVENYYPSTVDDLLAGVVSLSMTINHLLAARPPGVVMTAAYRKSFLEAFAQAWPHIQGLK